jgi:hypothetical protein
MYIAYHTHLFSNLITIMSIPRNLSNDFEEEQLIAGLSGLTMNDVVVSTTLSVLGKRKWSDTEMSNHEIHQPYHEEEKISQPMIVDYIKRYVHVIPRVESDDEDEELEDEEQEDEVDTQMIVVEDGKNFDYDEEDGEIFEPKVGRRQVFVDEMERITEEIARIKAETARIKEETAKLGLESQCLRNMVVAKKESGN